MGGKNGDKPVLVYLRFGWKEKMVIDRGGLESLVVL